MALTKHRCAFPAALLKLLQQYTSLRKGGTFSQTAPSILRRPVQRADAQSGVVATAARRCFVIAMALSLAFSAKVARFPHSRSTPACCWRAPQTERLKKRRKFFEFSFILRRRHELCHHCFIPKRLGKLYRVEGRSRRSFPRHDIFDRNIKFLFDGNDHAALCGAVELGETQCR